MKPLSLFFGSLAFLGVVLYGGARDDNAFAQLKVEVEAQASTEGIEPLTRGPLHEAFIEVTATAAQPMPIIEKKPPEPINELPPDQSPEGHNVNWIAGYWAFDDTEGDYLWVSGHWRDFPPGRTWVTGYWSHADGGWQWVPGYWASADQTEFEYAPPPPESIEAGPSTPAPSAESAYAPGCWVYRQSRFYWRPGFWYTQRPGWVYCPDHWVWTPSGYLFVNSCWDYPLERRGVLFASVRFGNVWLGGGQIYRPYYALAPLSLYGALFARPAYRHYYYGDYFDPTYARVGFVPWFDFQIGRNAPNPLLAYYGWRDRQWVTSMRGFYEDRRTGRAPRPPSTFVEQNTTIKNITVNNTVRIGNQNVKVGDAQQLAQDLTMVAPLANLSKLGADDLKLQTVSKQALGQLQKNVERARLAVKKRQKIDAQVRAQGGPPVKPSDPPRKAKIDLPKIAVAGNVEGKAATKVQPPPLPETPKQVDKTPPKSEAKKPQVIPAKPLPKPPDVKPPAKGDKKPPDVKPPDVKPPAKGDKKPPDVKPPDVKPPAKGDKKPDIKPPVDLKAPPPKLQPKKDPPKAEPKDKKDKGDEKKGKKDKDDPSVSWSPHAEQYLVWTWHIRCITLLNPRRHDDNLPGGLS